jgi:hypothetical protein
VNKKHFVRLSEEEREELRSLVSTGRASARKLTRARILLKADQGEGGPGWTDEQIAEALETSQHTVRGLRKRFTERGSQGAINRKKGKCSPVRVRKLDYEYRRNGTANVFMFTEPLAGWRFGKWFGRTGSFRPSGRAGRDHEHVPRSGQ